MDQETMHLQQINEHFIRQLRINMHKSDTIPLKKIYIFLSLINDRIEP